MLGLMLARDSFQCPRASRFRQLKVRGVLSFRIGKLLLQTGKSRILLGDQAGELGFALRSELNRGVKLRQKLSRTGRHGAAIVDPNGRGTATCGDADSDSTQGDDEIRLSVWNTTTLRGD